MVNDVVLAVDPTTKGSPEAFVSRAVEPDHGIKPTWSQSLGRRWLLSWSYQDVGFFLFGFSLGLFEVFQDLEARESFLKEHGLTEVRGEVDQDPAVAWNFLDACELCPVLFDLCLNSLDSPVLLSSVVAAWVLHLLDLLRKASNLSGELKLSGACSLDFPFERGSVLVGVGQSQLSHVEVDIELVWNLLTGVEALVDALAALPEVLAGVELFLDLAFFRLDNLSVIFNNFLLDKQWVGAKSWLLLLRLCRMLSFSS